MPGDKDFKLDITRNESQGGHICLIYQDEKERRQVMSKFISSGVLNNEKVIYLTDIMPPKDLIDWIEKEGIVTSKLKDNQLDIYNAYPVYCPDDKFDPDKMLKNYKKYYQSAIQEGFSGIRLTGETCWLINNNNIPGSERFIEYEARVNNIVKKYPVTTMCQYDARLFDGATIFNILQIHPFLMSHGQIVKNPAYIKPKEFLKKWNYERR